MCLATFSALNGEIVVELLQVTAPDISVENTQNVTQHERQSYHYLVYVPLYDTGYTLVWNIFDLLYSTMNVYITTE
jgi:hypothetical protein